MKKLAIIPARGGSKRIPRKNIKDFLGKPIISYSIMATLDSNLFDEVMVSTDDKKIADISLSYGAKIPFYRSSKCSNDYSTTLDVIKEVLAEYENLGRTFDYVCCLYPTAPFVTQFELRKGFKQLVEGDFDSLFPVMRFSFPIQRALKIDSHSKISFIQPEFSNARSQDLDVAYHDAGQFYWLKSDALIGKSSLVTENSSVIIIDESKGQDIDNLEDWKLAELKYKVLNDRDFNI